MPKLVDDPTYRTALAAYLITQRDLYDEYRAAMASAASDRLARALATLGGTWNEAVARKAFNDWQDEAQRIGMDFMRKALVASGRIELAKRFFELGSSVSADSLSEDMRSAIEELRAGGDFAAFESPVANPEDPGVD